MSGSLGGLSWLGQADKQLLKCGANASTHQMSAQQFVAENDDLREGDREKQSERGRAH